MHEWLVAQSIDISKNVEFPLVKLIKHLYEQSPCAGIELNYLPKTLFLLLNLVGIDFLSFSMQLFKEVI